MSILEKEKAKIEALWNQGIDALENGDWESYSAIWAQDQRTEVLHPAQSSWWTGWKNISSKYQKILDKGIPIHGSTRRMNIQLGPSMDVAWMTTESELKYGKTGKRISWQVVIFQKIAGEWKIILAFDAPRRSTGKK